LKKNGDPFWNCAAKFPKTIYYVSDKDGKHKYSTDKIEDVQLEEGDQLKPFPYLGCPRWYREAYEEF